MKMTNQYTKLYLDDIRIPKTEGWVIVRTYDEFVNWITKNGLPEEVSFDHDLAEINHHINFLENENRLSRHSKKKSEIKFDKTHKVLPAIDGKKIYQEYNMQFEQNNIIITALISHIHSLNCD